MNGYLHGAVDFSQASLPRYVELFGAALSQSDGLNYFVLRRDEAMLVNNSEPAWGGDRHQNADNSQNDGQFQQRKSNLTVANLFIPTLFVPVLFTSMLRVPILLIPLLQVLECA